MKCPGVLEIKRNEMCGGRFYPDICSGARAPYWPHPFPLHSTRLKYHTHGLGGLIMTSLYDKEILRKRTSSQLDCCDPANSKLVADFDAEKRVDNIL